jgi:hypothetical protein
MLMILIVTLTALGALALFLAIAFQPNDPRVSDSWLADHGYGWLAKYDMRGTNLDV